MTTEKQQQSWHQATVSWGQFITGIVAVIVTVCGAVFYDRLGMDRRLTVVEERQSFVLKAIEADQKDVANLRSEINRKLDSLQAGQAELLLQLTKHEVNTSKVLTDKKAFQ